MIFSAKVGRERKKLNPVLLIPLPTIWWSNSAWDAMRDRVLDDLHHDLEEMDHEREDTHFFHDPSPDHDPAHQSHDLGHQAHNRA